MNYCSWGPHHFRAHRPSSYFSSDNNFSLIFSTFNLPSFRKHETVEALRNFVTLTKVSSVGRRVQNCAAVTDLSVSPMKIVKRLPQTPIGWERSLKNAAGLRDTSPGLNIPQYFTINYPWNWQFRLLTLKTGSGLKNDSHFQVRLFLSAPAKMKNGERYINFHFLKNFRLKDYYSRDLKKIMVFSQIFLIKSVKFIDYEKHVVSKFFDFHAVRYCQYGLQSGSCDYYFKGS